MRDAINTVLDGARKKGPNIQTFDDLHCHLVSHPEQDNDFCGLLETSGYLSVWKFERDKNPWQYDLALMSASPANQIEEYCWNVLQSEKIGPNRYIVNRGGYLLFSRQYNLNFFEKIFELYEVLAELHRQRVDVATKWLEANGRLARTAPLHLIPHTGEWFAALEQWDPPKAMMVRRVIELTGRTDICSVCGDDPASDFYLREALRPAGGIDTLRLCGDCVQIRRNSGESFIPL